MLLKCLKMTVALNIPDAKKCFTSFLGNPRNILYDELSNVYKGVGMNFKHEDNVKWTVQENIKKSFRQIFLL
jgi:hypothetical protein